MTEQLEPGDTRRICARLTAEAREVRISTFQFAIALGISIAGLILFACALCLI